MAYVLHHLLHHGLRLLCRRDLARAGRCPGRAGHGPLSRSAIVGVVMAALTDLLRARLGALHLLSAADGERLVLHRARAGRRGSWIWCVLMMVAMAQWKRANPGQPVPLAMFATVANAVMWLWTTVGVAAELLFQVIPAALGWTADDRRRPLAHAVLLDAARDRLLLADPGLYRLLHDGAAGGRRPALQRHDGAAHVHPVPDLQPAGRHAPPVHGPGAVGTASSSCRWC